MERLVFLILSLESRLVFWSGWKQGLHRGEPLIWLDNGDFHDAWGESDFGRILVVCPVLLLRCRVRQVHRILCCRRLGL